MKKIIISTFVLAISSTAFAGNNHNVFLDAENTYISSSAGSYTQHDSTLHTFLDAENHYAGTRIDNTLSAPTSVGSEASQSFWDSDFLNAEK